MTSITREDEIEIYKLVLKGQRQSVIAKQFHISQGYVSQIYKRIIERNDRDLSVSSALEFVAEYTKAKDYLNIKLFELEELLTKTEDIKEKEKIIMSQVSVQQLILNLCSQGKFMQAVQEFGYDHPEEQQQPKPLEGDQPK